MLPILDFVILHPQIWYGGRCLHCDMLHICWVRMLISFVQQISSQYLLGTIAQSGYFDKTTWLADIRDMTTPATYFDSVTGKALFIAPKNRTLNEFLEESQTHGWPSFRDEEVVWENVRCLSNGEVVSLAGTRLGRNVPDGDPARPVNRYSINLVSISGTPTPYPIVGTEEIMAPKTPDNASTLKPVLDDLRFGVDGAFANQITRHNRSEAEPVRNKSIVI